MVLSIVSLVLQVVALTLWVGSIAFLTKRVARNERELAEMRRLYVLNSYFPPMTDLHKVEKELLKKSTQYKGEENA